jgi:tetratricopeptide (TPR) repeat protein
MQAGRTDEAINVLEEVVDDALRLLSAEHPSALAARANLASAYRQAGRISDAIAVLEKVVADRARLQGAGHPLTVAVVDALRAWRDEA